VKTRQQKQTDVEQLHQVFAESPNALLIGFQGIKVADDERLRRDLRQSSLTYRVVKNTLAVRASVGTPIEQVKDNFVGSTAIALSKDDPVTLAKVLSKWAKENTAIAFKAGVVEGRSIDVRDVEALANLPSKEQLISQIMFLINCNAQRMASALSGVSRNLAIVFDQIRAQKEGSNA
jgi:large subunit ribosomal protein L10